MELKKLCKRTLHLWLTEALIISTIIFVAIALSIVLTLSNFAMLKIAIAIGIVLFLIGVFIIIYPLLRHRLYRYYFDDKQIVIKKGVVFRTQVVVPICQIQDLHVFEGPIMMMFSVSGVEISTAGSNFKIACLEKHEAKNMVDVLLANLENRLEELKNEKV